MTTPTTKQTGTTHFNRTLDPSTLIKTLDTLIDNLATHATERSRTIARERLRNMQVVTMNHHDKGISWLLEPPTTETLTIPNSLSRRLWHLVKSGGVWLEGSSYRHRIQLTNSPDLPIRFAVDDEAMSYIEHDADNTLFVKLVALRSALTDVIASGHPVAVFERPYGVTAVNELKEWLRTDGNAQVWGMEHVVEMTTLDDILESATINRLT